MLSVTLTSYIIYRDSGGIMNTVNGILMGLIIVTPLAGFVSPMSALILGIMGGPIFIFAERYFSGRKWFSDPVGLLPEHLVGGMFGVLMIAFFTQHSYALLSGNGILPNGLFFGGGYLALHTLGVEIMGIVAVAVTVFVLSYVTIYIASLVVHGILEEDLAKYTAPPQQSEVNFKPPATR